MHKIVEMDISIAVFCIDKRCESRGFAFYLPGHYGVYDFCIISLRFPDLNRGNDWRQR